MTDADAVLSQNLEFYRAFSTRDLSAMDRLWARDAPVSCIHPGWAPLSGRGSVLASWRAILTGPTPPMVLCFDERATLFDGLAMVVCEEQLETVSLAATNLFVLENRLWRMVHHQSSQIVQRN